MASTIPARRALVALALLALTLTSGACRRREVTPAPTPSATPPAAPLLDEQLAQPTPEPPPASSGGAWGSPEGEIAAEDLAAAPAPPAEPELTDGPIPPDCEDYVQLRMSYWENKQSDYQESGQPFAAPSPDLERLRQVWRQTAAREGERSAASRCRTQFWELARQMH